MAWERMEDRDGRGWRSDGVDLRVPEMPRPWYPSGVSRSNCDVDSFQAEVLVADSKDLEERHLNDMSEMSRCGIDFRQGRKRGRRSSSLMNPKR